MGISQHNLSVRFNPASKLSLITWQAKRERKVTILFGTQTGTAERFANELKDGLLERYGKDRAYEVLDVEDYEHAEKLPGEELVFLMLATYGDGEPTNNAVAFHGWLTDASEAGEAEKLKV